MKFNFTFLVLLAIAVSFISCDSEMSSETVNQEPTPEEFGNLEVGDVFYYSFLEGESCWLNSACSMTYTGDTLELEVMEMVDGKFVIEERITPGSAIFDSEHKYIYTNIDVSHTTLWDMRNDSLKVTSIEQDVSTFDSHLLRYPINFSFQEHMDTEVEIVGWSTSLPFSESRIDFFIENGEILGTTYPHLNGQQDNVPMAFDNNGTAHIFNKENGIVRITQMSAWVGSGFGWDKIN